jgi:hypothetical protein
MDTPAYNAILVELYIRDPESMTLKDFEQMLQTASSVIDATKPTTLETVSADTNKVAKGVPTYHSSAPIHVNDGDSDSDSDSDSE